MHFQFKFTACNCLAFQVNESLCLFLIGIMNHFGLELNAQRGYRCAHVEGQGSSNYKYFTPRSISPSLNYTQNWANVGVTQHPTFFLKNQLLFNREGKDLGEFWVSFSQDGWMDLSLFHIHFGVKRLSRNGVQKLLEPIRLFSNLWTKTLNQFRQSYVPLIFMLMIWPYH